jgi:hypothetical protein
LIIVTNLRTIDEGYLEDVDDDVDEDMEEVEPRRPGPFSYSSPVPWVAARLTPASKSFFG